MAIGAQRRDVFWLVAKQGGVSILLGLGAGLSAAFALQRFLTSLFYEGQSVGLSVMIFSHHCTVSGGEHCNVAAGVARSASRSSGGSAK